MIKKTPVCAFGIFYSGAFIYNVQTGIFVQLYKEGKQQPLPSELASSVFHELFTLCVPKP